MISHILIEYHLLLIEFHFGHNNYRLITKLPIFDTKKLSEIEMVEKNLLKLKEE